MNIFRYFSAVFLSFFTFGGVFFAYSSEEKLPNNRPIAYDMALIGDESRFRLLLDFDSYLPHRLYLLDSPNRLVLDLANAYFAFGDGGKKTTNLVEKIGWERDENNKNSRIILNLTSPIYIVSVVEKEIESIDGGGVKHFRLIIDCVRASDEYNLAATGDSNFTNSFTNNFANNFTIVIDPGHGGIDGGAVRGSILEKDITFQFSKLLQEKLLALGFRVILTRQSDIFVALAKRRQIAEVNSADLFISVHADAAPQSHVRGATFYTLSKEGGDELSKFLAQSHNEASSFNFSSLSEPVSDILLSLVRRETKKLSIQFSQLAISNFAGEINLISNPNRGGNFAVLRNPYTPSVLLELGYLSNEFDAKLLVQESWQAKVAGLLAKSVETFFAGSEKKSKQLTKNSVILFNIGE